MTSADKLAYLLETKNLIKEAIAAKGIEVSDDTPFRQYVELIGQIGNASAPGFAFANGVVLDLPSDIIFGDLVLANGFIVSDLPEIIFEETEET